MVRTQKHRRTLTTATALAVLFSSATLSAITAGSASADTAKVLSLKSAGDVVVDGVHQRVYISDPTAGKIVVTDYAGTAVATLTGLTGVDGLALSADSGQIYAAVAGTDRIVSVETSTYTQTASYDLGGADSPHDLASASGKLWFSYGVAPDGAIGSLDLSGAEPVVTPAQTGNASFYTAPVLASDPDSGLLVAGEESTTSGILAVYDVSGGTATLRANKSVDASFFDQLAVSPDGTQVVTASGYPYAHPAFSTTDLTEVGRYPSGDYGSGVAIAPDGTVAAGTSSWYGPDVHVFRQGGTTPVREYEFPNTGGTSGGDTLADGALAWAPDGSRIFAVSVNSNNVYTLRALTDPNRSLPKITVTAPSSATRAKALTVTGTITASVALPAGTPLTVTRTDLEYPKGKSLPAIVTKAGGAFSFADTTSAGGSVTYKVSYAGDATHAAASGSDTVAVSRTAVTLTLNNNKKVFTYGKAVAFTATLGKTYKNRTVKIYADRAGDGKGRYLIKSGNVNSKGQITGTLNMYRDSSVYAVYDGDARTAARTLTVWAGGQAHVVTSISRQYKNAKIGSTTYAYVHKTSQPYFNTTMNPYPGRKQRLDVQMYYKGTWYNGDSEYFKLSSAGKSIVNLGKPGASSVGYKYRFRSSYLKGTNNSGDSVNSTVSSSWKYMYVTN
ncbi:WD40 repeat domain-containing protein [Streptomyces beijiangensis]|uniref:Ig-like domain repeat protein n=1 Tax=Streptomyces beijiangensis TaxID=163361 RepID=A0A939F4P1_9ACTN|nr:Ig-like domain repeat protein [Streptomyces beijiangensis]MBO0510972.1 Ig-like domain repeat protein [Streptomyces beijiangensis]